MGDHFYIVADKESERIESLMSIHSIPGSLSIDGEGKIIAKDLRHIAVSAYLAKLF